VTVNTRTAINYELNRKLFVAVRNEGGLVDVKINHDSIDTGIQLLAVTNHADASNVQLPISFE
jgi:hypothetical protein